MPPEDTVLDAPNEVVDDRRAAIAAAFEAEESKNEGESGSPPAAKEAPVADGAVKEAAGNVAKPVAGKAADDKPTVPPEPDAPDTPAPVVSIDKPPQSWRAPQKAKWGTLDPEVRQEVMRREREITRTLGETAQARQFETQFRAALQPYQARLNALGAHPMVAIQELLKADYILSSAPKTHRAQLMAKLINDYDIDVRELDSALAGTSTGDPVESRVEQLLAQRLAPLQQFLAQQQQREQMMSQQSTQEIEQRIEQMEVDPKYPHFDTLREDMADLIDVAAKRGLYLSLEQAYTRAVAMNPEVSQQVAAQRDAESKKAAALTANARAQKALKASVSVGGAPSGVPSGASNASDRRATIAAALDAVGGR